MREAPRNFVPEPFAYGHILEVDIEDLTNLGDGVARVDGWVVFVPFALPGERVRVRIWRNKKNYSDADLVEVLRASEHRVEPRCPLFGDCGGCQYQHYSYSAQLEWKSRQIQQLLQKMLGRTFAVAPCIGDPAHAYGYRSKITPHFRFPPNRPDVPIGFQRFASRSLVDVAQCPIASPSINVALARERENLRSGKRTFRRGGTLLFRDSLSGVIMDARRRAAEMVGDWKFEFVAGEFFQNNPYVLPKLVDYAVGAAAGAPVRFLVDAYCGVGVFGICGHQRFEQVVGIEVNEQAVLLADENIRRNAIPNMVIHLGKAEAVFATLRFPPEQTAVLLDPPRKGCDNAFIEQLLTFHPRRIVYVSCGPDTQARDIGPLLAAGYRVVAIQPFDLFPQTRHIENVVVLDCGANPQPG